MDITVTLFGIEFPSSFFTIVLLFVGLFLFFIWLNKKIKNMDPLKVKSKSQVAIEGFFHYFHKMVSGMLGEEIANDLTPIIMLLFLSIFIGDATGLICLKEVSYQSVFPIVWGFIMFLVWNGYAIKKIGLKKFFKSFAHPNVAFIPIEIISFFSKLLSIIVRLLGNITSAVIISLLIWKIPESIEQFHGTGWTILSGIIFVPVGVIVSGFFALFEPFIQALVFSMISLGNISMLIEEEN